MELIFENLQKGGSHTGAGRRGRGASGLTGAGETGAGETGAGRRRGGGPSGLTGAGRRRGGGPSGLTGAGKKLSGHQLGQIASHHTKLYGAGWFGDFVDGFKDGFNAVKDGFTGVMKTALPILDIVPGMGAITAPLKIVNGILGGKKPRRRGGADELAQEQGKEAFNELLNKENHKTGGKRPNKRTEIVKRVMAKKGLSLMEASSYDKTHNLYKK